jgi:hypothetical protein
MGFGLPRIGTHPSGIVNRTVKWARTKVAVNSVALIAALVDTFIGNRACV